MFYRLKLRGSTWVLKMQSFELNDTLTINI